MMTRWMKNAPCSWPALSWRASLGAQSPLSSSLALSGRTTITICPMLWIAPGGGLEPGEVDGRRHLCHRCLQEVAHCFGVPAPPLAPRQPARRQEGTNLPQGQPSSLERQRVTDNGLFIHMRVKVDAASVTAGPPLTDGGADWEVSSLEGLADLAGAKLVIADLSKATLVKTKLVGADLSEANLAEPWCYAEFSCICETREAHLHAVVWLITC
jgi:Pentapeptide repeats (8 copies)